MIPRQELINLIHAARVAGRSDYARSAAADWLAVWPGDLEVQFLLAQAEVEQGLNSPAVARLTGVLAADPEFSEAYDLLASALRASGDPVQATVFAACAAVLRSQPVDAARAPSWAAPLTQALADLAAGEAASAVARTQQALSADPGLPLPTLVAMRAQLAANDRAGAISLARVGHDRWPECLAFRLLLADDLLERGQTSRGVDCLHRASADDPQGRVAARMLGADHLYQSIWPKSQEASLSMPIPAEVLALLGEHRLGLGPASHTGDATPTSAASEAASAAQTKPNAASVQSPTPVTSPEDGLPVPEPWEAFRGPDSGDAYPAESGSHDVEALREVRDELDRVARKLKFQHRRQNEDQRVPAYVVVSCRTRLTQAFGQDKAWRIDEAIVSLVEVVRRRQGWAAYRLYLDDPTSLQPFGLTPADPQNAWQLKLRLADLDTALSHRGEMIGALLIVGGPGIVPFHMLPNPTDDDDDAVPSDNPYATTDENYFAPEWAVGRLPSNDNPELLVNLLQAAAQEHRLFNHSISPVQRLRLWLGRRVRFLFRRPVVSFGYSANIWRKASLAVFRTIGDPASMVTSPPAEAASLPAEAMRPVRLSYYNLHGLEDSPEWFGQRDPFEDHAATVEYPVALRPQDVVNGGRAPRIVYTEACYGANVFDKTVDSALCLKFLSSGARSVVGSTKTSYGSVTPPLIAADLLGRLFWDNINHASPAGDALRRAKLNIAAEMQRRQGFLDGEDQKTIISFVLYGDPLYTPRGLAAKQGGKVLVRRASRSSQMKTTCALAGPDVPIEDVSPATMEKVKSIVARYLPGMSDALCRVHSQHCEFDSADPQQVCVKGNPASATETLVVTFAKKIDDGPRHHAHLARLTLDKSGKVLKLAVSR
jgi:hypothetical protein